MAGHHLKELGVIASHTLPSWAMFCQLINSEILTGAAVIPLLSPGLVG